MFRSTVRWSLVLILVVAAGVAWSTASLATADKKPEGEKAPEKAAAKQKESSPSLEKLLATRVDLDKGVEKNTPLSAALEFLSETFRLTIIVNDKPFAAAGLSNVEEVPVALARMKGVRLGAIIKMLVGQAIADSGCAGTYLIRSDHVEITTTLQAAAEIWGENYTGRVLPWVSVRFDQRPLDEALEELADLSSFNIVVDSRVKQQAKMQVTSRLLNTPVDTAVRVLADMADLKPVAMDNLLYVTSKENAKELEEEQAKRSSPRKSELKTQPDDAKPKAEKPLTPKPASK